MFRFLKNKLKTWFGKSKKDIELAGAKAKSGEKRTGKKSVKAEKPEKRRRTKEELKEERQVTEKLVEDISKENLEVKSLEEKTEELLQTAREIEKGEGKKADFFYRLKKVFAYTLTEDKFEEIFLELENLLLESNAALEVVEKIHEELKAKLIGKILKKEKIEMEIKEALKEAINNILINPENPIEQIKDFKKINTKEPFVILFFGINGAGKTTSIVKFAHLILKNKISCILAAADTFRAASIEQISIHAERLGVKVIKHDYGGDPSAVAFDAIKYAKQNNIDVVLIDTAGRMHTKENLLHEMEKICRVTKPNLKVFVAEAIAGNDAVEQAKAFNEAIGIDGSILSKTDVDEKGGTILSVSYITKKPILYLGTGQNYKDIEIFSKEKFIERLEL